MLESYRIKRNEIFVADSRDVAKMINFRHADLLLKIRKYIDIMNKQTSLTLNPSNYFIKSQYLGKNNQNRTMFYITRKGCDMIANKLIGEKGVIFTAVYVDKFEEMEKQLKNKILPQTKIQAVEAYLKELKRNEKLENENLLLANKNRTYVDILKDLIYKGKANMNVGTAAKLLFGQNTKLGSKRLYNKLRKWDWMLKRNDREPKQHLIDRGYFTLIMHNKSNSLTPLITPKGLVYIGAKLLKEKYQTNTQLDKIMQEIEEGTFNIKNYE